VFKVDNAAMGFAATSHLIAFGHRTIACIQPASPNTPSRRRVDGYLRALTENGLTPTLDLMTEGNNLVSGGEEAVLRLLQSAPPFTAIYAANDAMAIGAMRGLRSQGLRIPHDVSIVGTDDITLAAYVEPPLTTIAQPKQSAGHQAVHYLIERIEGKHTGGPREVLLETQLVSRGSCAAPRLN
jgi:LacI family repressor for deo operon, udp, cdd, tsx, nupC, and nupG